MWIARDRDGELFVYYDKPKYNKQSGTFNTNGWCAHVDSSIYPNLTHIKHEDSPQEIVLTTSKSNDRLISLNAAKEWLVHNTSRYTVGNDLVKEFEEVMLAGR